MAYREVRRMDIDQVIRRWLAGEGIRAIARSTGTDGNTVRRIVRFAEEAGVSSETPWPNEGKLQAIRQGMGRPGAVVTPSAAAQRLQPRTDCFERVLVFFGGCPRRIVMDGMKACIDQSDPYTPRFNRTFRCLLVQSHVG
jgi:hypothetical protein